MAPQSIINSKVGALAPRPMSATGTDDVGAGKKYRVMTRGIVKLFVRIQVVLYNGPLTF